MARVRVGRELHPLADSFLAAGRAAGLRVVLVADESCRDLRPRADEAVAAGRSLTAVVHRLQADGRTVALLSAAGHRALQAADVGLGLARPVGHGPDELPGVPPVRRGLEVPWTADLVASGLPTLLRLVAATATARQVSERGRVLALSASTLGALLLVSGSRRGGRLRAVSPITGAALVGAVTGVLAGWRAAALPVRTPAPLVPWHAWEAADVLARLPAPASPWVAGGPGAGPPGRGAGFAGPPRIRRLRAVELPGAARAVVELSRNVGRELADPLTPVLSVGAAASAVVGAPTDAALVSAVMMGNALISARQRQRAERALHRLLQDESATATVLVGAAARAVGEPADPPAWAETVVPAERLRTGDVIALRPGMVVPADGRLLDVDNIEVDESALTGESVTVEKQVEATPGTPPGERACMVYAGSTVVAGEGRAVVVAVDPDTESRRALSALPAFGAPGGVQAQLHALTGNALPLTLGGGAGVALLGMLRGLPLAGALAEGIAVAVAAVPEGLPLVATVAQLAAARRLSRHGVLVRSNRTVEALGRVDTVCFDKTGTLTEGRLRLVRLADPRTEWTPLQAERVPDARRLLRAAARACPSPDGGPIVHATDRAVLDGAAAHLDAQAPHVWQPVDDLPFDSNRGYAATVGRTRRSLRLVVKGAPEVLLPRCTRVLVSAAAASRNGEVASTGEPGTVLAALDGEERRRADQQVHALASQGLRVLAVARRDLVRAPADLPGAVSRLTLLGFVGLADAPRPSAAPVLVELHRVGIAVHMITGDHPATANAVAAQLGLPADSVITGSELAALDEAAHREAVDRHAVFARVTPEQKVRIVAALQARGRVVAMSGDGSNDAAAIRLADVGIGIGAAGSTAARHAADLILAEPDLTLILHALVEGRAMWQRVRDAVAILVGGNAGEVVFTLLGTAATGRAPVTTRQFLLVNLLTDMFPAMAVAVAGRRPIAQQAAADPDAPLTEAERAAAGARAGGAALAGLPSPELGRELVRAIGLRGAATAFGASSAWLAGRVSGTRRRASTMGLVALVGAQLGQTLHVGWRSPAVWVTAGASAAALVAIVQTPVLGRFFGCTPLDPVAWATVGWWVGAAVAASVVAPVVLPPAVAAVRQLVAAC